MNINMFWINSASWTYQPNLNFWNIDYLTYWLYFWDVLLLLMTILVVLSILWLWQGYKTDYDDFKSSERRKELLKSIPQNK